MSDVKCPYCNTEQEINHDDGYGYEDGGEFEQWCISCHKEFKFTTSISYDYEVFCQDDDHDMESCGPRHPDLYRCNKCDYFELRRS